MHTFHRTLKLKRATEITVRERPAETLCSWSSCVIVFESRQSCDGCCSADTGGRSERFNVRSQPSSIYRSLRGIIQHAGGDGGGHITIRLASAATEAPDSNYSLPRTAD